MLKDFQISERKKLCRLTRRDDNRLTKESEEMTEWAGALMLADNGIIVHEFDNVWISKIRLVIINFLLVLSMSFPGMLLL